MKGKGEAALPAGPKARARAKETDEAAPVRDVRDAPAQNPGQPPLKTPKPKESATLVSGPKARSRGKASKQSGQA